jgi:predicted DCC family thiol-disulfide oxidoreductase YuxK
MRSDPSPSLTVYFDGACPVCSREIALYRRQVGTDGIAWVDAACGAEAELGPDLSRSQALARLHVRTADGRLVSGARAFTTLWQNIPRLAWLGGMLGRGPFPGLLEAGYRAVLVVRRAWRRSDK